MKAVLSNPTHPEYGVATIPLPIPKGEYDHCIFILNALEIGDAVTADCKVEEIHCDSTILRRLENSIVNVDELDYLAKRLDGFDKRELAQFLALTVSQNIHEMGDFINLTFSCQSVPIVQDFTDLETTGRLCYMDRHGGTLSTQEQALDFRQEAMVLLQSEQGKITPYGVIFDADFQMEQLYDGRHFPQYRYEDCTMEVELFDRLLPAGQQPSTYLCLPMSELQLERALLRGECLEGDIAISFLELNLAHEVVPVIDYEGEKIEDINRLCQSVASMNEQDIAKYNAAIEMTKPNTAAELKNLAEQLDLFDFVPGISTVAEYGKYMICESGHFEYDKNLEGYYNFEGYGSAQVTEEQGEFTRYGYLAYKGVVSLEEIFAGVSCDRIEMGGMS